jgi:hypothetical protein
MMGKRQPKFNLAILIALFGLLLLIAIGVFTRFATAEPPKHSDISVDEYPGPETKLSEDITKTSTIPEVQQILEYEEALKHENLSEEMRHSLETKIEILSRVATQIAMIKETPTARALITLSSRPTATFVTGLREGGTSDFHAWEADIKNIWRQYGINQEHIVVYAGELGSETKYPGRGVIYVLRATSAGRGGSREAYLLPEGTGWVRISEIKGNYIILTSKEGEIFYFYLPAQQFVSTLTDTAPTVTALPTSMPLPTIGPPPPPASVYP